MPSASFRPWPRAIALIDMNAFFASVEQLDYPELQGRPIGVTNGLTGTCVITSSYEARKYGIKTGMRVKEAKKLCPDFVQRPARPERYSEVSSRIMTALQAITPTIEVFSVDEAFLDLTACQAVFGSPIDTAKRAKEVVLRASGLLCSVGVSGDKTTAKFAAKLQKPNGFSVIEPWNARERLRDVPLTDLCGIKKGIGGFLEKRGIVKCGDMQRLPISVLAQRFGNPGRRIWYMAQGEDPDPVRTTVPPPKSVGHSKIMPPGTRDKTVIQTYLLHMSEKVGARLRKHSLEAQTFAIGVLSDHGYLVLKYRTVKPTDDGREVYALCMEFLTKYRMEWGAHQVQITALDPQEADTQEDLFLQRDEKAVRRNKAMDAINAKYGEFTLAPALLMNRSDMPNVISPAWKPFGHRQTI